LIEHDEIHARQFRTRHHPVNVSKQLKMLRYFG